MKNPWLRIPPVPPRIHSLDGDTIDERYSSKDPKTMLHLECLPEPYLGRIDAPVVLLGLKPGFDPGDPAAHAGPAFQAAAKSSLAHEPTDFPLYLLDPAFASTPGGVYYRGALKELAARLRVGPSAGEDQAAWKTIANGVMVINYFPYHSVEAKLHPKPLTSQQYGFWLAKQAVARQALVVIVLGETWWLKAVPELRTYSRRFTANNTRSWTLSPGNVPTGFEAVVAELT